jgi:hypothetical protein
MLHLNQHKVAMGFFLQIDYGRMTYLFKKIFDFRDHRSSQVLDTVNTKGWILAQWH